MGKKKKAKSTKPYSRVGDDGEAKNGKNSKASNGGKKLRRSKRSRRPVEMDGADDCKFRQSVEGR